MKQYLGLIVPCILLSVFLLNGCTKQPLEETVLHTTQNTQSGTESTGAEDEGKFPAFTIPRQTESETQTPQEQENKKPADGESQSTVTTDATKGTDSPVTNEPTEDTKPSDETKPAEGTESNEPILPPQFDEDELPPIPV